MKHAVSSIDTLFSLPFVVMRKPHTTGTATSPNHGHDRVVSPAHRNGANLGLHHYLTCETEKLKLIVSAVALNPIEIGQSNLYCCRGHFLPFSVSAEKL